jgi:hypothetical protein
MYFLREAQPMRSEEEIRLEKTVCEPFELTEYGFNEHQWVREGPIYKCARCGKTQSVYPEWLNDKGEK